jgi:hypothetical protein
MAGVLGEASLPLDTQERSVAATFLKLSDAITKQRLSHRLICGGQPLTGRYQWLSFASDFGYATLADGRDKRKPPHKL